jgi:hypothetical protein
LDDRRGATLSAAASIAARSIPAIRTAVAENIPRIQAQSRPMGLV